MAEEIELKLTLPDTARQRFLRHPLLRQAVEKHRFQLRNQYFDTPALDLRANGLALRLRAKGSKWVQTVKAAGDKAGGLSIRPEWEAPYAGTFDFSIIDAIALRDWLDRPKIRDRLVPVFTTDFQRTTWLFERGNGTRLEVALDQGWIRAGERAEAIAELEIELLAGDAAQVFDLARAFAERVPLFPAPQSKAERGYRLFQGIDEAPSRGEPPRLSPRDLPLAAFRTVGLACLDHWLRNLAGALASDDPEYIHQMRIASRRLRAALRLFKPCLPAGFGARLIEPLRAAMDALGRARDADVLLATIAAPVRQALPDEPRVAALIEHLSNRRAELRVEARCLLAATSHGGALIQVLEALHGLPDESGAGETALTLPDFAAERLRRLRRRMLTLATATRASRPTPESLHALRIGLKRLRYALEFFASLANPATMRRRRDRLVALQDRLGQINDLANAGALLMQAAGNEPALREAASFIVGWHGPRYRKLLKGLDREIEQLGKLKLPPLKVGTAKP